MPYIVSDIIETWYIPLHKERDKTSVRMIGRYLILDVEEITNHGFVYDVFCFGTQKKKTMWFRGPGKVPDKIDDDVGHFIEERLIR